MFEAETAMQALRQENDDLCARLAELEQERRSDTPPLQPLPATPPVLPIK
jgi:hypothetical protein